MAEKRSRRKSHSQVHRSHYWHHCSRDEALPTASARKASSREPGGNCLHEAGADLVLNGHDHLYARYAPIKPYFDATMKLLLSRRHRYLARDFRSEKGHPGILSWAPGGGETLDAGVVLAPASKTDYDGAFNQAVSPGRNGELHWGVMALTLDPNGYQWDYESALEAPVAPSGTPVSYSDKGSALCHGGPWGNNY